MSFEQQLEDLIAKAVARGIVEGIKSLPFTLPADPGALAPAEKRTRKPKEQPKEEAPLAEFTPSEAPVAVAQALPPVTVQTPVVAQAAAAVSDSGGAVQGEPLPEIERRHVSAALISVAQSPEHGPAVAYGILTGLAVKDVSGLKPAQYVEVVAKAAGLLGITVLEALKLEPKKV